MNHVPERLSLGERSLADELLRWIDYETDAAYAAKLAILRLRDASDIAIAGVWLRDHVRHADELAQLVRALAPERVVALEPSLSTRDAFVIGALSDADADAVLEALRAIDRARAARYATRPRICEADGALLVDALLVRHAHDAAARIAWLDERLSAHARDAA
jgi:hypothetical protein